MEKNTKIVVQMVVNLSNRTAFYRRRCVIYRMARPEVGQSMRQLCRVGVHTRNNVFLF